MVRFAHVSVAAFFLAVCSDDGSTQEVEGATEMSPSAVHSPASVAGFPDAAASDPRALGWMQGFPPEDDRIIRYPDGEFFTFPQIRWTVCNFRQLMPTRAPSRGTGAPEPLVANLRMNELDAVEFMPLGGDEPMSR